MDWLKLVPIMPRHISSRVYVLRLIGASMYFVSRHLTSHGNQKALGILVLLAMRLIGVSSQQNESPCSR